MQQPEGKIMFLSYQVLVEKGEHDPNKFDEGRRWTHHYYGDATGTTRVKAFGKKYAVNQKINRDRERW
jgi:hypothetical protein